MIVEILTFADCPNAEPALANVREALRGEQAAAEIRTIDVRDPSEAVARRFLGSPTIRVDGEDVEAGARARTDFAFACRTYATPEGPSGVPPPHLIAAAIRRAHGRPPT